MTIEPGRTLLHYRIVEKIGEGGMGAVWRAQDTTLGRQVAVKVLPQEFAADPDRLARFEREAKLLASLSHPNIAGIHGLHESEGVRFLVMEMVEGEDLSQRLARGPLPLHDTLEIAVQVAQALEAAHDNGVIHRDLKPANIQLTPGGKVKVLDFGLAKALAPETASGGDPSRSPTMTSAGTLAGLILGTAGYMSPEQARGRDVDRRADVWAFGAVVYEMLTAKRAFDGETISDTLASVLKVDPDWDALPAATPAPIRRLLRRCLQRDLDRRLSHLSGARVVLREALDGTDDMEAVAATPAASAAPSRRSRAVVPWALAALLGIVAATTAWWASTTPVADTELMILTAPFPEGIRVPNDQMGVLALSPDGKTLALALQDETEKKLYVRKLGSPELVPLTGTEDAATPFFSPDGRWIGFFANDKLKKVSVAGGTPITLCEAEGSNRGASWGTNDLIVFSPHYTQPLMQVSGAGGEPTPLTRVDPSRGERTHRWPQAVPNEDVVLFTVGTMDSPESYEGARIDAIRPSSGEQRTVLERASMARYLPSGHLVFGREGFLFAVPFDIDALETRGSPVPVLENVMGMRSSGVVHAGFARDGLLAYIAGAPRSRQSRLEWRSLDGRSEPLAAPVAGFLNPQLSPDRKRIALEVEGDSTFDIWIYDLEQETLTRLTFEGDNTQPVWSPDGTRIAFASVRNAALTSVYVKAADGAGKAELIYSPDSHANAGSVVPTDWSPDGRFLLLELADDRGPNVYALSLEDGQARVVLDSAASEQTPAISPDGRWLAYSSDEAGDFQVFVRPFPEPGGKWQISIDGGFAPRWSPDGRRLFFRWRESLYAVGIDGSGTGLRASRPEVIFEDLAPVAAKRDYDPLDGERFLIVEPAEDSTAPTGVTVVVNWLDELKRRVPE